MALSRERVRDEVLKLLGVADPVPTLRIMFAHRIFAPVLPELDAARLPQLRALIAAEDRAAPVRRLAVLLPAEVADAVAARLRLSNAERRRLVAAAAPLGVVPEDPRALAWAEGKETAVDRLLIAGAKARADSLADWRKPALPLGGRDVMAAGVREGPEVARILGIVEREWVAAGFPESRQAVLGMLSMALNTAGGGRDAIQPGISAAGSASE
jgi:poly(A) polymerase